MPHSKTENIIPTLPGLSLAKDESLKNGIWPKSVVFWLAIIYMALFIIRPWERLLPWLGLIHFERFYAIFMISAVFLTKQDQFSITSETWAVLLFLLSLFLTTLFAQDFSLAWGEFYKYVTLIIFYFVIVMVIRTPYEMLFFTISYIIIMTIYLAKAQWEYFLYGHSVYRMGVSRLTGIEVTFGGPNELAGSVVLSLPLAYILWKHRQLISTNWPSKLTKYFPIFLISYLFLAITSIIFTNSRSGMLAFILFLTLVVLTHKGFIRKFMLLIIALAFLFTTWLSMPEESRGRFETLWNPRAGPRTAQQSTQGRIQGLRAGIAMFKKFPLTGVGLGNFIPYRVHYVDGVPSNPHNLLGQLFGETGLIGFLAFSYFVIRMLLTLRNIRKLIRKNLNKLLDLYSDFAIACRDVIILLLFLGLPGHNLTRFNWLWIAVFASLTFNFTRRTLEEETGN